MDNLMVSICCITYNHEKYIADAIESFLMQECNFDFEILIHDDASTDKTPDIIRQYEMKYPNVIKPIYQSENKYSQGVKISAVYLYPNAQGKYIALCEGDDYWTDPKKLQMQVEYMEKNPMCSLSCHGANVVDNDGVSIRVQRPFRLNKVVTIEDVLWKKRDYIPTASMLFPTELVKELPPFYYNAPIGDLPLQIFLTMQSDAYYIDKLSSDYRHHVDVSWTKSMMSDSEKLKVFYSRLIRMYEEIDEYSGYEYHESIKNALVGIEFEKYLKNKCYRELLKPKFKNNFRKLPFKSKIYIYLNILKVV